MERLFEFAGNHPFLVTALVIMIGLVIFHEVRRKNQGSTSVATQDGVRLINRGAAVVDVREAEKFAQGHIINARNVAFQALERNHEPLAKLRKKTVLVVCDNGATSARAAEHLRKAGFEQVFSLRGGLNAWRQENLPLVRDGSEGQGGRDRAAAKGQKDQKGRKGRGGGRKGRAGGGSGTATPSAAAASGSGGAAAPAAADGAPAPEDRAETPDAPDTPRASDAAPDAPDTTDAPDAANAPDAAPDRAQHKADA